MGYMLAAVLISFTISLLFVWQSNNGATWGHDTNFDAPQKVHHKPVPRMGGVGIFIALAACAAAARFLDNPYSRELILLVACSVPAVAFGLAEDVTGRISSKQRLAAPGPDRSVKATNHLVTSDSVRLSTNASGNAPSIWQRR